MRFNRNVLLLCCGITEIEKNKRRKAKRLKRNLNVVKTRSIVVLMFTDTKSKHKRSSRESALNDSEEDVFEMSSSEMSPPSEKRSYFGHVGDLTLYLMEPPDVSSTSHVSATSALEDRVPTPFSSPETANSPSENTSLDLAESSNLPPGATSDDGWVSSDALSAKPEKKSSSPLNAFFENVLLSVGLSSTESPIVPSKPDQQESPTDEASASPTSSASDAVPDAMSKKKKKRRKKKHRQSTSEDSGKDVKQSPIIDKISTQPNIMADKTSSVETPTDTSTKLKPSVSVGKDDYVSDFMTADLSISPASSRRSNQRLAKTSSTSLYKSDFAIADLSIRRSPRQRSNPDLLRKTSSTTEYKSDFAVADLSIRPSRSGSSSAARQGQSILAHVEGSVPSQLPTGGVFADAIDDERKTGDGIVVEKSDDKAESDKPGLNASNDKPNDSLTPGTQTDASEPSSDKKGKRKKKKKRSKPEETDRSKPSDALPTDQLLASSAPDKPSDGAEASKPNDGVDLDKPDGNLSPDTPSDDPSDESSTKKEKRKAKKRAKGAQKKHSKIVFAPERPRKESNDSRDYRSVQGAPTSRHTQVSTDTKLTDIDKDYIRTRPLPPLPPEAKGSHTLPCFIF